jgi:alpha-glucosidase
VPLPWSTEGVSFGFGSAEAHLPQPAWFRESAVEVEDGDPASTLSLYREALRLRHPLQTGESLEWIETGRPDVLRFVRPNGWQVVANFGTEPFDLGADAADAVLSSAPLAGSSLPGEATVWLAPADLLS